jgi:hypothetical protein
MNTVNRIVIVLLVLVLLVACLALSFAPLPILRGLGQQMVGLSETLAEQQLWLRIAAGVLFAVLGLAVSTLVLILELYRPRPKTIRVEKVDGGEVEVSLKTISDRVTFDVDRLPGILRVRPKVSVQRGGVLVEVAVEAAGEAEVPDKAAEIIEVVRRAVEERIGVKLAQPPKVKLNAAPVPTATSSAAAPVPPPPPAEPLDLRRFPGEE